MSETVDTRVVRMEFDNKQFEKNISKTNQSLETLKQNLNFKGLGDSLDEVRLKISALEITITTFIVNIANRITNLGINIVKSLSVDNISAGWSKFGEKTTSVATMMAQKIRIAGQEITDFGAKTEVVNKQLELLNWFSDETSYSFNDMVNSVGKFTAAGQDLDTSVKAMEGIATWAALSGQNAQTASRAMYQLAQAMGKGKIQKIDWISIENANMGTEEFKETILSTAVALGELTKEGNQFVTKTGKKFTQSQFAEFLSEGWFTSDVLVKGLNKYSAAVDQIYEISERTGKTASEVIEEYGDQLDAFGLKAFKAAQEARTFADVLNSVRDAVSSKWMTTFESIFGTEEEAVKLWTDLANELYDVFAESGNFRNDILAVWKELGGRDDLFARGGDNQGAFWNIYDAIIALRDLIKSAWDTVFPLSEMEEYNAQADDIGNKLKSFTNRIREFTENLKLNEVTGLRISKIFQGLFNVLKIGINTVKTLWFVLDPLLEVGKQLVGQVIDETIYYGNKLIGVSSKLEDIAISLRDMLVGLLDSIDLQGTLSGIFTFISKIFNVIADVKPLSILIDFVKAFVTSFKEVTNIEDDLGNFFGFIKSIFRFVSTMAATVMKLVFQMLPVLAKGLEFIFRILGYVAGLASKLIGLVGKLTNVFDSFTKKISNSKALNNLEGFFGGIVDIIKDFIKGISKLVSGSASGLGSAFQILIKGVTTFVMALVPALQVLFKILGVLLEGIGTVISKIANTLLNILTGKNITRMFKIVILLGIVALIATAIYNLVWIIRSILDPLGTLSDSLSGLMDGIALKLKAGALQAVANTLLEMTLALALLAAIDEKKLVKALAASIVLLAAAYGIMVAAQKMSEKIGMKGVRGMLSTLSAISQVGRAMVSLGLGLVVIAGALTILSKIDSNRMLSSFGVAMVFISSILVIAKLAENIKFGGLVKFALSLHLFSGAIMGMALVIGLLSKLDIGKVWNSVAVIIAFTALVAFVTTLMKIVKAVNLAAFALAMFTFGVAMGSLSVAIAILSQLDPARVWSSFSVIVAFTAMMALITILMNVINAAHLAVFSAGMVVFGIAMTIMAGAIAILGNMSQEAVDRGKGAILAFLAVSALAVKLIGLFSAIKFAIFTSTLIAFATAMTMISANIVLLGSMSQEAVDRGKGTILSFLALSALAIKLIGIFSTMKLAVFSVSLMMFASAMTMMSAVIAILGAMDSGSLFKAIGAIATLLASIVAITALMRLSGSEGSLFALALGVLLLSAAINSLVPALLLLSGVEARQMGIALLGLAGGLLVLIAAAALAQPLILTIIALSAAMLLAGVGMLAAGVGLTALATGIDAIVLAFKTSFDAIREMIMSLSTLLIDILFAAVQTLVDRANELIPSLITLVESVIDGITTIIFEKGPQIFETILTGIEMFLQSLDQHIEPIYEAVHSIIVKLLRLLTENHDEIVDALIGLIVQVLNKVGDYVPQLVGAVLNLLAKIVLGILGKLAALAGVVSKVILAVFAVSIKIVIASLGSLSRLFIAFVGGVLMILLSTFMGMSQVIFSVLKTAFREVISLLIDVIMWAIPALALVGKLILQAILAGLLNALTEGFSWILDLIDMAFGTNLAEGLRESVGGLANMIANDARSSLSALGGGIDEVQRKISEAGDNINNVVSFTADAATDAVMDGIGHIDDAVSEAIGTMGDSLESFGEVAGANLLDGIESTASYEEGVVVGENFAEGIDDGARGEWKMHSPSRVFMKFGEYLVQGLAIGISDSEEDTTDTMSEVISNSMKLVDDIINDRAEDGFTIKVKMDISNVEAQTGRIQDIMSGINNPSLTPSGINAAYNSMAMNRKGSSGKINTAPTTNNSNEITYNNTFNIQSTDPSKSAEEIDKILQQQALRKKMAHGT